MAETIKEHSTHKDTPLRTLVLEELSKTSDSPEKDISLMVNGWLKVHEDYKGNGEMGKFIKSVKSKVDEEDYVGAVCLFIDKKLPIPLIGSVDRALREERTLMRLFFTTEAENRVLIKDHASATFKLGGAAHILMESLVVSDGDLNKFRNTKIKLERDAKNNVVGFSIPDNEIYKDDEGSLKTRDVDVEPVIQHDFGVLIGGKTTFILPKEGDVISTESPSIKVNFIEPLDSPKKGESIPDWARRIISESINTIKNHNGGLPGKPSDVEKIFEDDYAKPALMKVLEAAHVIFGVKSHLNLVNWSEDNTGSISYEGVDVFAVLNWLAIARKTLDLHKSPQVFANNAVMSEMKEGPLRFAIKGKTESEPLITVPLQGNKIDSLRLTLNGKDKHSGWELKQFSEYLQRRFNSQDLRHRSYKVVNGERKLVSTRLLRNTRTLFAEVYRHFGERVFKDLVVDIDDFKFLGGDGNWSEQYDATDLPVESHKRQVSGYIFKVLSQLCWLKKTLDQREKDHGTIDEETLRLINFPEKEDIVLTVEEVIDFGLETGVINRIHGHLLYQLPNEEIRCDIGPTGSERDELIEWGKWATKLNNPKIDQRDRLRVVRGLSAIVKPLLQNIEIKRKPQLQLPGTLKDFCVEWRGKFYLSVEDFWKQISNRLEAKKLELVDAYEFTAEGVKVMWFKGLIESAGLLRIAVDKNGSFSITNLSGDEFVNGRLLTNRENKGVSQRSEKLIQSFDSNIWTMLKHFGLKEPISYESPFLDKEMIMPDGTIHDLAPGKPIVCKYNLLTGKWYLDPKLLEEAVGTDGSRKDHVGIHELAQILNKGEFKGSGKSVWCPIPTHDNKNTRAAILNEGNIRCQSGKCGQHVFLPSFGKIKINREAPVLTKTVFDFKFISKERQETFDSLMNIGEVFARNNERPNEYLVNERGIHPSDIGRFAYIPSDFNHSLEGLVFTQAFRDLSKRIKHKDTYSIESFESFLKDSKSPDAGIALDYYHEALEILRSLPPEDRLVVSSNLSMKSIMGMEMRGILESRKLEDKSKSPKGRLAERIIVPTYWISSKSGLNLVQGNFNARGIEMDGQIFYKEQAHHKAYLVGKKKTAPAGFYIRDPQVFLESVRKTQTVIVSEGPFNTASFSRMVPSSLASLNMTNMGTGYQELIAFLRWMGIYKDKVEEGNELEMNINKVILAFDFDEAGAVTFQRRKEIFENEFPQVEVVPVHDVLPSDIRSILPEFDPKIFKKGEKYDGFKLDLNDLIKKHKPGWAEENKISSELVKEIEKLRLKYAYLPK